VTNQIPSLNRVPLHRVPPNTIVRYRGMVQDMLDPEYYLAAYPTGTPGRVRPAQRTRAPGPSLTQCGAQALACGMYRDLALGGVSVRVRVRPTHPLTLTRMAVQNNMIGPRRL
jgi:hypothetical protein